MYGWTTNVTVWTRTSKIPIRFCVSPKNICKSQQDDAR